MPNFKSKGKNESDNEWTAKITLHTYLNQNDFHGEFDLYYNSIRDIGEEIFSQKNITFTLLDDGDSQSYVFNNDYHVMEDSITITPKMKYVCQIKKKDEITKEDIKFILKKLFSAITTPLTKFVSIYEPEFIDIDDMISIIITYNKY